MILAFSSSDMAVDIKRVFCLSPKRGHHTSLCEVPSLLSVSAPASTGLWGLEQFCKSVKSQKWTCCKLLCEDFAFVNLHFSTMWRECKGANGWISNALLSRYAYTSELDLKCVSMLGGWFPWRQIADSKRQSDLVSGSINQQLIRRSYSFD